MAKTMCKIGKKKLRKRKDKIQKYKCERCEATANKENQVCKPVKM